jgi:hypothetical protein
LNPAATVGNAAIYSLTKNSAIYAHYITRRIVAPLYPTPTPREDPHVHAFSWRPFRPPPKACIASTLVPSRGVCWDKKHLLLFLNARRRGAANPSKRIVPAADDHLISVSVASALSSRGVKDQTGRQNRRAPAGRRHGTSEVVIADAEGHQASSEQRGVPRGRCCKIKRTVI